VRACKRLSEAAKTLTTRDHVRGISGPSTLFNKNRPGTQGVPLRRDGRYSSNHLTHTSLSLFTPMYSR
jgi:hypothetical protein